MSKRSKVTEARPFAAYTPHNPNTPAAFDALWETPNFLRELDSLTKRQPALRAKIWQVLNRYLSDVQALQRSPLTDARRRVFHTRIDKGKRLIDEPLGPSLPREVAILHVGHHDPANQWGALYSGDTFASLPHSDRYTRENGDDTLEGPEVDDSPIQAARSASRTVWWEAAGRPSCYGDYLKAGELRQSGVEAGLVAAVLKAPDTVDLEELGLPADIADRVLTRYLQRLPSSPIRTPVPAIGAPMAIRTTRAELPSLLRLPLHRLLATMSDEQRRLATREGDGLYVVKGAAGSGKTVVGIRRIEHWLQQRDIFDTRPILFTCYNKVLAHAARQMLEDTIGHDLTEARVAVKTAYKLMSELQAELEGRRFATLVSRARLLPIIGEARVTCVQPPSILRWSDDEILDEVLEVIVARALTSESQYLDADRTGRGRDRRPAGATRSALWDIYRAFRRMCEARGLAPWDQLPARMAGLLARHPVNSPRYAAIVIDEAQDLPASVFRVLLALQAGDERNILVLGDAAQNVYRNTFRWSHTGLHVTGRVTILRRCFRSTPSIVGAAIPLIRGQLERLQDDLVLPESLDKDLGPSVTLRLFDSIDQEIDAVAEDIAACIEGGTPPSSIGVLLDSAGLRKRVQQLLEMLGCPTEDYIKPGGQKYVDIFDSSVKLLTTASAKGIEFQVLFIPVVTEASYPSSDGDGEAADRARRSLYTAMVRCAHELHLSADRNAVSGLVSELDQKYVVTG